ncbi:MAG: hypothetical protein OSB38_18710 [Paraburkholderia fungorum]|nr:hypothetical protein [Paraburkholderia fungorum]
MRCYQLMRRTPLGELTVAEHGALQLERAMLDVRKQANMVRASSWMSYHDMRYSVGFFNGVRFTILQALDFWTDDYDEFSELAERYASEVEYLAGPYLERRAA